MATLADLLRAGYVPPTDSALADPIKEHFKTLPQQLAKNQAALDSAIGSWNKTDFATGQPNPNYRPEAIAELTQLMPNMAGMIKGVNGQPLTLYHGTKSNIEEFVPSKGGEYGGGIYFGETPEQAFYFAKNAKGTEGENIIPVHLDIKNPLNVTAYERDKVRSKNIKQLEKKGYDGIVATGLTGEKQYIAFKPEQVVSTITKKPITRKDILEQELKKRVE